MAPLFVSCSLVHYSIFRVYGGYKYICDLYVYTHIHNIERFIGQQTSLPEHHLMGSRLLVMMEHHLWTLWTWFVHDSFRCLKREAGLDHANLRDYRAEQTWIHGGHRIGLEETMSKELPGHLSHRKAQYCKVLPRYPYIEITYIILNPTYIDLYLTF